MSSRALAALSVYFLAGTLPLAIAGMNLALGLATVAALWSDPKIWKRVLRPEAGLVALYALWAFASGALGVDPSVSRHEAVRELHKVWTTLILLCVLPEADGGRTWNVLVLSFSAAALIGIGQTVFLSTNSVQWVRAHAFVHAVTYGEQLAIAALGSVALALCVAKRDRPWAAAYGALCTAALLLSQTRAAAVGLAAGFAAVCWAAPRLRRRAAWAFAFVLAAFLLFEVMPTGGRSLLDIARRHGEMYDGHIDPQRARYALWEVAWKIFKDHPLSGVGPGNYKTVFDHYFPVAELAEKIWGSAHNLYLHQLAERGLVGEVLLLLVLGALLRRSALLARKSQNLWALWSLGGQVSFAVMSLTEVAFQKEQAATLILFLWAAAEAFASRPPREKIL
jgi:O-antigen ligase